MMMLMMKKKKCAKESLAVLALLLASANCILPPSKDDLNGTFMEINPNIKFLFRTSCGQYADVTEYVSVRHTFCALFAIHRDLHPGGEVPGQTD